MKEKTYLIALVCDLRNINNKFTDLHFFIRSLLHFFIHSLLRQTKESENCWEKKRYSGIKAVYGNDIPNEATLQALR